jgi:hypothetical protein
MTWRESPYALCVCAIVFGGAALASACAKGDTVDPEHVDLFKVPEASVRPDAGVGGKGSGGRGSGGSLGSGGSTSGGAPMMGKGGSGAGGRAAGGRGEDGGSGMGGKASGGAPAMGGSSSGGRASGGTSTGGGGGTSGSGSGGKATGGTMSGGSAGMAGAGGGTGGAMQCPNYPTNDNCSKCICSKCATQVASCYASSDATKNDQCKAIQECAEKNHCASTSCYCGTAGALCLTPNGPCLMEINAAGGGMPSPLQVQQFSMDTTHPIGRANAIGTCSTSNCKTECGL